MINKSLTKEITNRMNSATFINILKILPDPDYVLEKAGKTIAVFREIAADPHVSCCIQTRKSGVLSMGWNLSQNDATDDQLHFHKQWLENLNIKRIIAEILNAPYYGFQVSEIIWAKQKNGIIPADIKGRPNDNFLFDANNQLRFRSKNNMWEGELIPEKKVILVQHNALNDNPYGERILSKCFWPVFFKKTGARFWAVFLEKFATPWVFGKTPKTTDDAETQLLLQALETLVQDGIAVIPDDASVEIMEAAGKTASADIFEKFVTHGENDCSKAILGQTLTTQIGDKGSYAAANIHNEVKQDIIDADKEMTENAINLIIRWCHQFNFNDHNIPTFYLYKEEEVKKEQAEKDQILNNMGVSFNKLYFQRNYNLKEDEFEVKDESKKNQTNPSFTAPQNQTNPQFSQKLAESDPQNQLDDLIASFSAEDLINQTIPMLAPVIQLIKENAADENELLETLADIYPYMDDSELIEKLTRAYFIAEMWGKINENG
jgi:phage gp29-like protein